jgi:hypothetical protein
MALKKRAKQKLQEKENAKAEAASTVESTVSSAESTDAAGPMGTSQADLFGGSGSDSGSES